MTPDDLDLVRSDAAVLGGDADRFARTFYDLLFDLAPGVRSMFPQDLSEQRRKLMSELTAIVTLATSAVEGDLDRFVERTQALGRRHVDYGAATDHYAVVGTALLGALATAIPEWDARHEHTWTTVYRLVAHAMQEGAATVPTGVSDGSQRRKSP